MHKLFAGTLAALLLTVTGGCGFVGPSLDSFYTSATVAPDDNIVGVWESSDDGKKNDAQADRKQPSQVVITPLGKGHYRVEFLRADGAPTGDATINATLFKLASNTYLDATLSDETRKALNEHHFGMLLYPHYLLKVEIGKDEIQTYTQDIESLIKGSKEGEKSPFTFRKLVDGDRPYDAKDSFRVDAVLVGTTEELQRAMTVAESRGMFTKGGTFKRVKPAVK